MDDKAKPSLKEVFLRALELPCASRPAFLDSTCSNDEALRARVEDLLRAHEGARDFFASPTVGIAHGCAPAPPGEARSADGRAGGCAESDGLIGTMLGGCRILDVIGSGAAAVVFKAEQVKLARQVALKVLRPAFLGEEIASVDRFLREARSAANLEHPNIVPVYDVGEERGRPYLIMQLMEAGSVKDVLKRSGRLPWAETLRVVEGVANALQAAHAAGIIHRDVKPSNILLDRQGVVKLADFGLARFSSEKGRLTSRGALLGTPYYMSPEQCRGAELDIRSDIYSLGVTLYELVTGSPPFDGELWAVMHKHQHEPPPPVDPSVPRPLATLMARMLAKDPAGRYPSAFRLVVVEAVCFGGDEARRIISGLGIDVATARDADVGRQADRSRR